jgi:alkylation response protein AidB-like acyl-CoA dehydrogenase
VQTRLHNSNGQLKITGRKALVRGAPGATHWLVSAQDDAGQLRICLIDPAASGVQRRDIRLIDGAWAAELAFDQTPVQAVLGQGDALPALAQAWDTATLAAGAEAVGVMQSLMRDTLDYTSQRKQFGQPLAAFQALQHRMADMYMALVQAAAAVGACADVLADSPERRAERVSSAHGGTFGGAGCGAVARRHGHDRRAGCWPWLQAADGDRAAVWRGGAAFAAGGGFSFRPWGMSMSSWQTPSRG